MNLSDLSPCSYPRQVTIVRVPDLGFKPIAVRDFKKLLQTEHPASPSAESE